MELFFDIDWWRHNQLEGTVDRLRRDALQRTKRAMELSARIESLESQNNELRLVIHLLMQTLHGSGVLRDGDLQRISDSLAELQSAPSDEFATNDAELESEPITEDLTALAAATERSAAEQEFREKLASRPISPEVE